MVYSEKGKEYLLNVHENALESAKITCSVLWSYWKYWNVAEFMDSRDGNQT